MKKFKKLEPDKNPYIGCPHCGGGEMKRGKGGRFLLRLRTPLGSQEWDIWILSQNGDTKFDDRVRVVMGEAFSVGTLDKWITNNFITNAHDFRATLYTPMRTAVYQRQAPKEWVLVLPY